MAAFLQVCLAFVIYKVTKQYVALTHELVKLQIEPQIDLETSGDDFFIANHGVYPVLNVSLSLEFVEFAKPIRHQRPGRFSPLSMQVQKLMPGDRLSIEGWKDPEGVRTLLSKLTPKPQEDSIVVMVVFVTDFRRDIDRKKYHLWKGFLRNRTMKGELGALDGDRIARFDPDMQNILRSAMTGDLT